MESVNYETVGQYTGLKDKHGQRIFEGDIVHLWVDQDDDEPIKKYRAIVEFGNPNGEYNWGWQLKMIDSMSFNEDILLWVEMEDGGAFCEVVGNIHDNMELLKEDTMPKSTISDLKSALIVGLPQSCDTCKHRMCMSFEEPCNTCSHLYRFNAVERGDTDNWEWRGVCPENTKEEPIND